ESRFFRDFPCRCPVETFLFKKPYRTLNHLIAAFFNQVLIFYGGDNLILIHHHCGLPPSSILYTNPSLNDMGQHPLQLAGNVSSPPQTVPHPAKFHLGSVHTLPVLAASSVYVYLLQYDTSSHDVL